MYIRVGVGGGSGYEIHITTDDTNLYGYTITISKNGTTVGTTAFDNTGEASFSVDETGTYTVSVTYDGNTYSENVVVSAFEVELSAGFVLSSWLTAGDVTGTYANLAAVLADEEAVRKLMTIHAAVDYLASFESTDASVVTILNDNYAAKWISLTDYAMDVLEAAYGTLMGTIGKYGYGEWGITDATTTPPTWGALGNVPVMTSNSAPYGEAISNSVYQNYYPWCAFSKGGSSLPWSPSQTGTTTNTIWLGYKFTNPVDVRKFSIKLNVRTGGQYVVKIQGSNTGDSADWHDASGNITVYSGGQSGKITYDGNITGAGFYLYWRVFFVTANPGASNAVSANVYGLQFYGRTLKVSVPKMSGNTTPYGEAFASSEYSSTFAAWKAFDQTNADSNDCWHATYEANPYLGYDFGSAVVVKNITFRSRNYSPAYPPNTYKIQGSNESKTSGYEDILSGTINNTTANKLFIIDASANNKAYRYYRMYVTANMSASSGTCQVGQLQFYGKDYSEREWDTTHPRRYLYDHGIEFETIARSGHDSAYGNGYTTQYPNFGADGAEIGKNVAKVFYPFVTDEKVDVTDYDTLAVVYEPFNSYGSTTNSQCGRVGATASKNPSDGYYIGTSYTTLLMAKPDPYTIADFSSLNGEYYIGVVTDENNRMDTIKELWLE